MDKNNDKIYGLTTWEIDFHEFYLDMVDFNKTLDTYLYNQVGDPEAKILRNWWKNIFEQIETLHGDYFLEKDYRK